MLPITGILALLVDYRSKAIIITSELSKYLQIPSFPGEALVIVT